MGDDVLIHCENVGKKFCRDLKKSLWYGLKDSFADLFSHRNTSVVTAELRFGEFWANKDISFEVKRGECLGLIGRNGAGKTTLLKMLSGLIKPDSGSIAIRGRIGALIALGAGFNPLLTARENIFINGSVLGLPRMVVKERLDEIVDFAGLEAFVDSPVKNFSSGMQVRLGFAIAAILLKPDVLLLDEILAVGDLDFRTKCQIKIAETLETAAVVLVSHNNAILSRCCTHGIMLDAGCLVGSGFVHDVLSKYIMTHGIQEKTRCEKDDRIRSLALTYAKKEFHENGEALEFEICVDIAESIAVDSAIVGIVAADGLLVAQATVIHPPSRGVCHIRYELPNLQLSAGLYYINLTITSGSLRIIRAKMINIFTLTCQRGGSSSLTYYSPVLEAAVNSQWKEPN